jgi:predicted O-methyltransferase YrrM
VRGEIEIHRRHGRIECCATVQAEGGALETLATGPPEKIDLLLLDGAKGRYPAVLALVGPRFRPGAFILADNADWSPDHLACVRSPAGGYLSVPFADDVELSMRIVA